MADASNILSGPAQVSIYDSTNDALFLGYHEIIKIIETNLAHQLIDKNNLQYGALTKVEIPLLQSDPSLLADIVARRSTKQSIYIVGPEHLTQIDNVYISVVRKRIFVGGKIHNLIVSAQTEVGDDVSDLINLMGSDGNCNTEVGSTGLATGWTESGSDGVDVDTSHLTGRGNQQEVDFSGLGGPVLYYDVICPIDQPLKITVSAYVADRLGNGSDFLFGIKTKDSSDVVVDTETEAKVLTASQETRISKTVSFTPGADINKISVYFQDGAAGSAELGIDDVQLQLGPLTAYTEND